MPELTSRDNQGDLLLEMQDICVHHADSPIIDDINLSLYRGEIVTLIGPNGAGKSTLVKVALDIIKADWGTVKLSAGCRIGYVPQSISLDATLPLTVSRFLNLTEVIKESELKRLAEEVGIQGILRRSMHLISGGELRRVLLCKALLRMPDLLILDEPTAGVDISGQGQFYQLVRHIRDRYRCDILLISHDLHIVMAATDHVYCLNHHLCCTGRPEQVQAHPEYLAIFGDQGAQTLGV